MTRTRISTAGNKGASRRRWSIRTGFTLLELVVVLVIMGIILGVTGPRFVGSLGGSELTRFSKVVAAYLRNARELSVVRNIPVKVTIDELEGSIACFDARKDVETLSSIEIPKAIEVALELDSGRKSDAIIFFPLGNATESRIVLESDDGGRITVGIEGITGDIYID